MATPFLGFLFHVSVASPFQVSMASPFLAALFLVSMADAVSRCAVSMFGVSETQ